MLLFFQVFWTSKRKSWDHFRSVNRYSHRYYGLIKIDSYAKMHTIIIMIIIIIVITIKIMMIIAIIMVIIMKIITTSLIIVIIIKPHPKKQV